MQIENLPLDAIKPYTKNPRKNKKGIVAVKWSIEEFGFTQPIIVKSDLTPQQERAYRIASLPASHSSVRKRNS